METEVLEDLGLTQAEIKVYLSLLELGTSRAGEVIKVSQLQNSVVHSTLGKLVEKGLASFVVESKVKHYTATNPRNLTRWIDEKKARFEKLLPQLIAKQALQERQEAEVFEGARGLKAMCYKFIEDVEPGTDYLIFAFMTPTEQLDREIYGFYREFTEDRLRRGLNIKGIAHVDRKPLFQQTGFDLSQWVFVDYPTLQNVSICGNRVIITPWQYKPISFMLTSRQIADNYREYFYTIWNAHSRN